MSDPGSPEAPPREAATDPDAAAARRTLVLFGVAVAAAILGLAVVVLGTGGDDVVERDDAAPIADLGPRPGADLERHQAEAAESLAEAGGRRAAIVSFTEYVDEADARAVLGLDDDPSVELRGWLVALPGGDPDVTTDIDRFREAAVAGAEDQLVEIERLLPTVDDADFAEFYEDELVRYRALIDQADAAPVFGAVVIAEASDLRALASQGAVRSVDVGPSDDIADGAVVRGIRPEETRTGGEPLVRPA